MPLVTSKGAIAGSAGLKTSKLRCMVCNKMVPVLMVRPSDQKPACTECAGALQAPVEVVKSAKKA